MDSDIAASFSKSVHIFLRGMLQSNATEIRNIVAGLSVVV
jgi:hypothetical protein